MKHEKSQVCSICRHRYIGFGNNAWPVNEGRCCDDCNWLIVVPARLADMASRQAPEGWRWAGGPTDEKETTT